MITVAFTVTCVRQKYLRAAIDSWARARGTDQVGFVFCLEPPPDTFRVSEFTEFVKRVFPGRAMVYVNSSRLGCMRNTRQAMGMALALSEEGFGVVAEEDLEVADDVVEYLTWARDCYREDGQVVAVCAHARTSVLHDAAAVTRAPHFNPLVWGTWRDRWDGFILPGWGPCDGNHEGWDRNLQIQVNDAGKCSVFPVRSRVVHRGETSTLTGFPLSEYYFKAFLSDCYAPHYGPQQFHEVPFPDKPGDLVV